MEARMAKKPVFDEDIFGGCINPQTGTAFNYNRKLASDDEIDQLILPDKLSTSDRLKRILLDGQKIQKWSVLENLPAYVTNSKTYGELLDILSSQAKELNKDLQMIMGYGLTALFQKNSFELPKNMKDQTTRLCLKILSYEQASVNDEWVNTFVAFCRIYPDQINEIEEYINRSFDFSATPERRRSALLLIDGLYEVPALPNEGSFLRKFEKTSEDHNRSSRRAICNTLGKHLIKNGSQEMWRIIWSYTNDKEETVKTEAFRVLTCCYRPDNIKSILQLFQTKDFDYLIKNCLQDILKTYQKQLKQQQYLVKLLHIFNKVLLGNNQQQIMAIMSCLDGLIRLHGIKIIDNIIDNLNQLTMSKNLTIAFIRFYSKLEKVKEHANLRNLFFQNVKKQSYDIPECIEEILTCIGLEGQQEFDCLIKILNKFFELSHWRALLPCLECLNKWKLTRNRLDRVIVFLMKLILAMPYFLYETVFLTFRHLILSSKKRLEFLSQVKQRLVGAKVCYHRKIFLLLQAAIYKSCSWQVQRSMPSIVYAYILNQKIVSVKMEYCQALKTMYEFIDPSEIQVKAYIRQIIRKYTQDKDAALMQVATKTEQKILEIDADTVRIQKNFQRNKELLEIESKYPQVEQDTVEVREPQTQKNLHQKVKTASVKKTSILIKEVEKPGPKVTLLPKSYSATVKPPIMQPRKAIKK